MNESYHSSLPISTSDAQKSNLPNNLADYI